MEKPTKTLISAIAVTVALSAAAIGTLPLIVDPNDFKPEIAAAVKDKTGRDLVLDGELKLSVFPWFGIASEKAAINNPPGFPSTPLASIEHSEIRLNLLPLLSKKVDIDSVVLQGLVINLTRNQQGAANWHRLMEEGAAVPSPAAVQQTQQSSPYPVLANFEINSVIIENARINWDDLKTGQHIEVAGFNLETGKFAFGQPVTLTGSLNARSTASQTSHDVKFNTKFTVNQLLSLFTLDHSELQLTVSGENVPGKALTMALTITETVADTAQQTAKISGLQLKSGDLAMSANLAGTFNDKPVFQGPVSVVPFNPANFMRRQNIALPAMQDANALSKLVLNFDLVASADSAELQNLAMTLDDSQVKGSFMLKDFAEPKFGFALAIDTLDADRYLKPANKESRPIASPAMLLAIGVSAIPAETLRQLNAEGTLALGRLKANGLVMQDVRIGIDAKNSAIKTQQSAKQFYQGSYAGELNIDAHGEKPQLAVNDKIDRVQIEPLLKDYRGEAKLSGVLNASVQLQGRADELKQTLNGHLDFSLKDGAIKGFSLQKIIDKGKALLKAWALPPDSETDQTPFSEVSGSATIVDGLLQNNDLVGKSGKIRVDGKGSINLNSDVLDYTVDAKLPDAEPPGGSALTIKVGGTLSRPSYTIDLESLWNDSNKARVEKLINKIDDKLAPGVGDLLKKFLH